MPTKTPREKIHELIKQNYNENTARCVVALVMPVFDALLEEARQEGIATCINLIPEKKEIVPLGGDAKFYAGYNAGLQLTRDNFDKYFNSL